MFGHEKFAKRSLVTASLYLLSTLVALTGAMYAQLSGATLTGLVTDPLQGAVPAASIVIRNNATGIEQTTISNRSGSYTVSDLQPGIYTVSVMAPSFSTFSERNLQLNVGTTRNLDVMLVLGAVTDKVDVIAGAADVETDTSVVSATVGQKRIVELPLNGRDWTQLATLQPGVNSVRPQASVTAILSPRAARGFGNGLTANGHSPYENTYRIDGINENDGTNGAPGSPAGVNLGVDAIQEFNVVTTAYTAEYGRTSGAVINAVTRSGTNTVHGTAFIFDRDKIFDARNPFDVGKIPSFHRTQFGGAVGFPIRKDKTFFFTNYEGLRETQSINLTNTVLTQDARNGLIHTLQAPTVQTQIVVDPNIKPFLALFHLPNTPVSTASDTGIYSATGILGINENFITSRFDNVFSANDSLSLTYLFDNAVELTPDAPNNVQNTTRDQRMLAAVSERHVFGPNLLNVLRLGYNRSAVLASIPGQAFNPAAANPALGYGGTLNAPFLQVTTLTSVGGLGASRSLTGFLNSYQFNDDVAIARGKHSIKTGFAYERVQYDSSGPLNNGNVSFVSLAATTGTVPAGTGIQNFLSNHPYAAQVPGPGSVPVEPLISIFGGYVQDDWRIRKSLSLNLGFRYEVTTNPVDRKNRLGLINTLNAPAGSGPCPQAIVATTVPGCTVPVSSFFQSNPTLKNFEPRLGFSYDLFGNGKTALRGAFGIYDVLPLPYLYSSYTAITSPFEQDRITIATLPSGSFNNGIIAAVNALPADRIGHYMDRNPKRDYSMNYNINIEQQFSRSVSSTIGYIGSHSLHGPFQSQEINHVAASQVQVIEGRYVFPATGGIAQDANNSETFSTLFDNNAHYNGLLTQLKVSNYHNLVAQATYTLQTCIDYGSDSQSGTTYTNSLGFLIEYDRPQRRGTCDYIVKQNFVANFLYELPSPSHGLAKTVAGGWQVGGIVNVSSGTPFTVLLSGDVIGQKGLGSSSFPDVTPNCPVVAGNFKSTHQYLNQASNCFAYATVAPSSAIVPFCKANAVPLASGQVLCQNVQGNERRNSLIGPRSVSADISLLKNLHLPRLSEATNLQFRGGGLQCVQSLKLCCADGQHCFGLTAIIHQPCRQLCYRCER